MEGQESNTSEKFRKVLFNEVSFIIAIVGAVGAAVMFITNPANKSQLEIERLKVQFESQQEISEQLQNIKDNDLHSLQQTTGLIQSSMLELQKEIVRLHTIIEERFPRPYP